MKVTVVPGEHLTGSGALGLCACPGACGASLGEDLGSLRAQGFGHIVCLQEGYELAWLEPPETIQERRRAVENNGMSFLHEPMEDFEAPTLHQAEHLVDRIRSHLEHNESVAVHCHAGIGRTGTIAACVLVSEGMSAEGAIAMVRWLRPGSVQSEVQESLVGAYEQSRRPVEPHGPKPLLDTPPSGCIIPPCRIRSGEETPMNPDIDTVVIENVTPCLDGGRYAVKGVVGDLFEVEANIFTHGHEVLRAVLLWRPKGADAWQETAMELSDPGHDRWRGAFRLEQNGAYEYSVLAWRDAFLSWAADLGKKHDAGLDLTSELQEGRILVEQILARASEEHRGRLQEILVYFEEQLAPATAMDRALALVDRVEEQDGEGEPITGTLTEMRLVLRGLAAGAGLAAAGDPVAEIVLGQELELIMSQYSDRGDGARLARPLEVFADRPEARYAAWYEMWPRSQGTVEGRGATFADMERRLPQIREMGFTVVYLPPIHPIGRTNRKGPNNSLVCPPGSPGCPYAVGNELGGHQAVEPELGTLEDFARFERACREQGMETALDLALQTSPDHPWVTEHPQWFKRRPDGSIKFAENPPKKYEDIYPLDFNTEDREGLFAEVLAVVRFWMERGVRIFRVDNPHTKPVFFWEWLIGEVHATDPDVLFLAEAFTRPRMMQALAKAGFTQSYTYFTWRNFKKELTDYFTELTASPVADYMRGNLFTNTPDILPEVLQDAPRQAFKMRATLAATLSSVWGMYNGFELCEGAALPGREEYLNSEKYDYKVWDWDRPGNIVSFIAALNRVRREHPALQRYCNLRFYEADNDNILFYGKHTEDMRSVVLVVVNLDPYSAQESMVRLPMEELGLGPDETFQMHELISDRRFFWRGEQNYVRLDPEDQPAHVLRLLRWSHREQDFDYFI